LPHLEATPIHFLGSWASLSLSKMKSEGWDKTFI